MGESEIIRQEKIKKLHALIEKGIDPYPYSFDVDTKIAEILTQYNESITPGDKTGHKVKVAGRVMSVRVMGKLVFMDLVDQSGQIQLFCNGAELAEKFDIVKLIDAGDIIGIEGEIFRTKAGQLSVWVDNLTLLNKSLTGIGDTYYSLKDIELKYRNRSLDMVLNRESKEILTKRFQMTALIRQFMNNESYLEVETPVIQTVYGGAAAEPFITHHHKLDMKMYMRVSPEQHLKRLLAGGMDAVYEIGKNFRNENIDRTHNPEFTMMEAYYAYKDYNYMMDLMERLTEYLVKELYGTDTITCDGHEVSFKRPWIKLPMKQALKDIANIDVDALSDDELLEMASKTGKQLNHRNRGEAILILFEEHCEKKLIQPTHIIDYPKESTVFCKKHRTDPELIERFETFIIGREVANGYSELNDPVLQRQLLDQEVGFKEHGAEEVWGEMDEEFIRALDMGMPPATGIGIGIDRLAMTILNQSSIRDIIYFPTMKPVDEKV